MEILSVTGDLSIEYAPDLWRVVQIQNLEIPSRPVAIANSAGMVFEQSYAAQAKLETNALRADQIAWVALDWDTGRSRWQIGLMLNTEALTPANLRVLVTWPIEAEYRYAEDTWKAADALASILGVPLRVNAAQQAAEVAQVVEAAFELVEENPYLALHSSTETRLSQPTEPLPLLPEKNTLVKLQPLPLEMGKWILRVVGGGLRWESTQSWLVSYAMRTAFFVVAFVVFVLLGIGSRTSGLAPVTPEWLPLMAFGIGVVFAYSAAENLWSMLTPSRVVFDDLRQEIRSERALTNLVAWRLAYAEVQYFLISQEKSTPQGRRSSNEPMMISQDVWVHVCAKDEFFLIGEVEGVMGKSWLWDTGKIRERAPGSQRYPLNLDEYDTQVHHAVQHLAEKLSVQAYVDVR